MKSQATKRATIVSLIGNSLLFILKLIIGIISGSLAVISDAINSFLDILTSIAVFISVKISSKNADSCHPFGHHRAEPIAGLIVAIVAAMLGLEIINFSVQKIISGKTATLGTLPVIALTITIAAKLLMSMYFRLVRKATKSPAIKACEVDSRNDVLLSGAALIGVTGNILGYPLLDPLAAIVLGAFVIKGGYSIGAENIDYLIGKTPPEPLIRAIKNKAISVAGVKGIHDVKAHFVGNYIHTQIHVEVDEKLSLKKAHAIGKEVEQRVLKIGQIDKAFIHIDPI